MDDYKRKYYVNEIWEEALKDKHAALQLKVRANCFNFSAVVDTKHSDWEGPLMKELQKTERYLFPGVWSDEEAPEEWDVAAFSEICAESFTAACRQLQIQYGVPAEDFAARIIASKKFRFLGSKEEVMAAYAKQGTVQPWMAPFRAGKNIFQLLWVTFGFAITTLIALVLLSE